ncbi:hypothetical protein [Acinetobacter faecalis]|uniref:Uncharacterized protein n=1 Tax=Acinetobacter faecalis TaxID=2665161 RepID=A0ABU5GHU4_9GAMM|nr:hypothetical protein [Acinetobacter faecalis]MDY6509854.1 hypothetical protein [Acinetobacter faecalis]MDY6550083.1 hypothetical protein [Acinetobacter faecalis]
MAYAIQLNPTSIKYIQDPSEYLCKLAISLDYEAIAVLKQPKESLCLFALSKSKHAIHFINKKYLNENLKNQFIGMYGGGI